jgi:hypothetical protein
VAIPSWNIFAQNMQMLVLVRELDLEDSDFLQHHIPGAVVIGKQIEEFQLQFECDKDAVLFILKYAK